MYPILIIMDVLVSLEHASGHYIHVARQLELHGKHSSNVNIYGFTVRKWSTFTTYGISFHNLFPLYIRTLSQV